MTVFRSILCGLLVSLPVQAGELFPFVMPWDDASSNLTNLASWNPKPAGKNGFVRACGSHLCTGNDRIRFLGVNIVFGSVAPTHEEADKIAARLARFGVNIVRFHHMDSQAAPNGLLQKDMKTFDPAVLERFDYFVAALKKEGIYSNINLHVGRKYPGFKDWGEDTPKYWKGVDNFYQPMIAMQKDFARELLTHRNPHTGTRYVEEPAVAFVEINNENGLIDEWRKGNLDGMTDPYRTELSRLWQVWLKERYKSDESLRAAWGVREQPFGKEMLGAKVDVKSGEAGWNLQLVGGAEAKLAVQGNGLTLAMTKPGKENWHTQLHQNGLAVQADQPYTLSLKLKAEQPQKVNLTLMQARAPWQRLWSQDVRVGTDWQNVTVTFAPSQVEAQARLTVTGLGLSTGQLQIADASLKPGGLAGLRAKESLETDSVAISSRGDYQNRTPSGQRDWLQFLWQTETSYWTGMQRFVKNDLGAKALIIGTQAHYSPAPIQAQLDVVDNHAYWQHPRFPGKPWDQDNWNIINSPMAGAASGGTLPELALRRVPGKPYVITEYNHSAPSHYQGEALPLLAAYGALQDWDGLFLYSYGAHGMNWNPGYINNFFDSHANPVKMASLIASAALWRRGDVKTTGLPASQSLPGVPRWIETLRTTGQHPSAEQLGAQRGATFLRPVSLATAPGMASSLPWLSETQELVWGYAAGKTVTVDTPRSKAVIGVKTTKVVLSGVELELLEARNDWATLLVTVLEGKDFASPGRILFTTLGQVESTGQQWDDKKTTLGRRLGKSPTRIEGIGARISLPVAASRVKAWALDERGNRREMLRMTGEQRATLEVGEQHRTLWYELEIR